MLTRLPVPQDWVSHLDAESALLAEMVPLQLRRIPSLIEHYRGCFTRDRSIFVNLSNLFSANGNNLCQLKFTYVEDF